MAADRYARSTDGSDADNGTTWALAKATIVGLGAIDTAGDRLFVSQVHAETTAGGISWNFAGTATQPTQLLCANDAAEPPTALATTATVTISITATFTIGGTVYVYGIIWIMGDGADAPQLQLGGTTTWQRYEQCSFQIGGTGASARIIAGTGGSPNAVTEWKDCTVKFAATGQAIQSAQKFHWNGGSVLAGGTSPTTLIKQVTTATAPTIIIENVDLSNLGSGVLLSDAVAGPGSILFRNCKLPSGWSGTLLSAAFSGPGGRLYMINCDAGNTNYKLWIEDYCGSIRDETTLVRTNGASDGVTPISWKMVTTANLAYPVHVLYTEYRNIWNNTTGSAKTLTVHFLRDSATNLKDHEIWVEANYLGDGSFPLGSEINDRVANVLTTAADQASSSETWTTTGMTNPNKQKCSVTFTPQKKGWYRWRVAIAKASTTVFLCPKAEIT